LQNAQKLGLHGRRQLPDFIEKDRAAVSLFETALRAPMAPVNDLSRVQRVRFDHAFRQGRAIEFDERPLGHIAVEVNGARHQFLADPTFAENENGGLRARNLFDKLVNILHRLRIANDIGRLEARFDHAAQPAILVFQSDFFDVLDEIQLNGWAVMVARIESTSTSSLSNRELS